MSKRGTPPRPPAPKISSDKKSSSLSSMTIRFNAAAYEDDVDDFNTETPGLIEIATAASESDDLIAKESKGSSPEKEEKSFFDGIKERITDAPLYSVITKKLEEISGDSSSSPEEEKTNSDQQKDFETAVKAPPISKAQSVDIDHPSIKGNIEKPLKKTRALSFESSGHDSFSSFTDVEKSFEIVDDFFATDTKESTLHKRSYSGDHISKFKTPVRTEISMSSLTSQESMEETGEVFYELDSGLKQDVPKPDIPKEIDVKKENTDLPQAVPIQKAIGVVICLFVYYIVPFPTFLSGAIFGAFLVWCAWCIHAWLNQASTPKEKYELPDLRTLPPLQVPEMKHAKNNDGKFKGWMNELSSYTMEDYHINQTNSVFVSIEGTALRLQRPRHNVPKRAMWDEEHYNPVFIHQRFYDLKNSKITLLPPGLVKKRIWSKKYPIVLTIPVVPSHQGTSVDSDENNDASRTDVTLYLFARTGREKELWYRRLEAASMSSPLPTCLPSLKQLSFMHTSHSDPRFNHATPYKHKRQGSTDSTTSVGSGGTEETLEVENKIPPAPEDPNKLLTEYLRYMSKVMPSDESKVLSEWKAQMLGCEPNMFCFNALIYRTFWDFLRDGYWQEKMKDKIIRKLDKIHLPFFIDKLLVTDINLGHEMPIIRRMSKPYIDEQGLWIDLDLAYSGGFQMTLETKVNLMKLKKQPGSVPEDDEVGTPLDKRSPITDSEEEDSAESSTDEEEEENTIEQPVDNTANNERTSKKLLRIVDKVTASKYFQQVTDNKYIKRAMESVSNTPLIMTVELKSLVGNLAINIPPPPSDRLWYGFRTNPRLWLSAKPKVGERQISVSHVTDWIEKKLATEFQRLVVMPNMDDLAIPLLVSGQPNVPPAVNNDASTPTESIAS
ncbi:unnamed protein product [Owenia fusiformis]|uniref:Uncharacterized protein n=1 Tax=Owenia fusiformis TaxID=6347 RepID=A0A8J1U793_OWEFU|nr:unnamed protein product [Owenia fusiformis]